MKLSLNLTFGFLFLGATMLMASCGNSDPIPQSKSSIVDIAIGNSDLNTLVAALTKAELVTISGSTVTLTDASGATANVLSTDVQGTNGVIHVIDKVLLK